MSIDTRRTISAEEYAVGAKVYMRTRLPRKVVAITDIVLSLPSNYSGPRDWYKADVWIGTDDGAAPWYYWTRCDDDGNPYPDQETSPAAPPVEPDAELEALPASRWTFVRWLVLAASGAVAWAVILKLVEAVLGAR